ncbi:hypothetical protein ACIRBX_12405 [Kitasatospora sp. NPDC096147]|uniref:hypothetical protein n=1 Tax=Kitasatospora sp. NPDC096147 TaxID=3364093 RepID=UPI003821A871
MTEAQTGPAPQWAVRAKVVAWRRFGEGGQELRPGLKALSGDAKVHVVSGYGGMGFEDVVVIGSGRGGRRYVTISVPLRHLHAFRPDLVYRPAVLRRIEERGHEPFVADGREEIEPTAAWLEDLARRYRAERWAGTAHPPACRCVDCPVAPAVGG